MTKASIKSLIEALKPWQQTAFACAIAERALPNYLLFAEVTEFGDGKALRQALNLLWDVALGTQSTKNFEKTILSVEENTPDPADFDIYGVRPALDVCIAISAAQTAAESPCVEDTLSVSKISLNTIRQFIQASEVPELEGRELNAYAQEHPLFQEEWSFQRDVLQRLKAQKNTSKAFIQELRRLASNEGVSQIGISL